MIKFSDLAMKILSALTLPLIGWGFQLSTQVAVLEAKVADHDTEIVKLNGLYDRTTKVETQIVQLRVDVSTALGQQVAINESRQVIAVLQEKLNAIVNNLSDIKDLLKRPVPTGNGR